MSQYDEDERHGVTSQYNEDDQHGVTSQYSVASQYNEDDRPATVCDVVCETESDVTEDVVMSQYSEDERPATVYDAQSQKRPRTKLHRMMRDRQQHPLLAACSCSRKCVSNGIDRSPVHNRFWEMGYSERKSWVAAHVKLSNIKRHRSTKSGACSTRNYTRTYTLPSQDFGEVIVCKKFFMTTLDLTCDKIITTAVSASCSVSVTSDRRGKHEPGNKFSDDDFSKIKAHIESYHPSVSHYRRQHAPFRRYLSPEISVTDMHKRFCFQIPTKPLWL